MKNEITKDSSRRTIAKEVLQDLFTMYMCFNIQGKIKNPLIQELYGYIMVFFYSIFLHELYQANLIDENQYTKIPKKLLNQFRQRFLKKKIEMGKPHLDTIRKEMEIDFRYFGYDIRLTVDERDNNKLYSINFGLWDLITLEKEKVELFNSLSGFPEKLIKELFNDVIGQENAENIIKVCDSVCEEYSKKIDEKIHPVKYPYSSAVFFENPEPEEQDKYLIMYYYTYFSLFDLLDEFVPALKLEGEAIQIDISYSLMKLKAMLIETFWVGVSHLNTIVVQNIKEQLETTFAATDVFVLNRRLRNNLHYSEVDKISILELKRIDDFQRKYIRIVLSVFNKRIRFKLGKWYHFVKWIADHTDSKIIEEKRKSIFAFVVIYNFWFYDKRKYVKNTQYKNMGL